MIIKKLIYRYHYFLYILIILSLLIANLLMLIQRTSRYIYFGRDVLFWLFPAIAGIIVAAFEKERVTAGLTAFFFISAILALLYLTSFDVIFQNVPEHLEKSSIEDRVIKAVFLGTVFSIMTSYVKMSFVELAQKDGVEINRVLQ